MRVAGVGPKTVGLVLPALWGLAAVVVAAAACGGTNPVDGPESGQDAAGDDAEPGDDGGAADTAPDTTVDGAKDGSNPAQGYCARLTPKPKFCDDFDDGDLTNNWDQVTVINGNSEIDLDPLSYTSPPASFAVGSRTLIGVNELGHASLRSTVVGSVSHPKLSFSAFYPIVALTKGVVAIATLDVSNNHFFTLYLRDGDMTSPGPALEESNNGVTTRHPLTKLPPAGVWTRIIIDLDFVAGVANVSFGADKALDAEPIAAVPGTEATIRIGAVYVFSPTDAFSAGYDDVVLDF